MIIYECKKCKFEQSFKLSAKTIHRLHFDVIRGAEMAWEPIKHTCGICGTINELVLKLEYRELENG